MLSEALKVMNLPGLWDAALPDTLQVLFPGFADVVKMMN